MQPLIDQIESVSLSGLSDKKAFLSARKNLLELKDKYSDSEQSEKLAEETFLNSFPGANLSTLVDKPAIEFQLTDLNEKIIPLDRNNNLRETLLEEASRLRLVLLKRPRNRLWHLVLQSMRQSKHFR